MAWARIDFERVCTDRSGSAAHHCPRAAVRRATDWGRVSLCSGIHLCRASRMPSGRRGPWATCSRGPNGRRLIGRQTHDLNECRERIKCVLSAAFILLSCPPFISHSFLGGVACSLGGLVEGPGGRGGGLSSWFWKPVGLLLMETTPVAGWKVTLTNSTCPVLYSP